MKTFLLFMLVLQMACSVTEIRETDPKERAYYEIGLEFLNENKFEQAEKKLKELLNNFPTTRWLSSAYFHLGYALEMQQKYSEAVEQYTKVVEYYQGGHSREEAEALYRLSICYEALGNDEKVILTLNQIKPALKFLSKEVVETEWPARLAAAYSRVGNQEEAKEYYYKADAGLRKIKSGMFLDSSKWLPKTFFSMGAVPEGKLEFKSADDFEKFLTSFSAAQIWLLRAVESKVAPWSEKAAEHIILVYNKAWDFIDKTPPEDTPDKMLALKKRQETQKAFATRLDSLLDNLRAEKSKADVKATDKLWLGLKSVQNRLNLLLQQRDVQDRDIRKVKKLRGKIKQ